MKTQFQLPGAIVMVLGLMFTVFAFFFWKSEGAFPIIIGAAFIAIGAGLFAIGAYAARLRKDQGPS